MDSVVLIHLLLILGQAILIKDIIGSSVWGCDRHEAQAIKAMYCVMGFGSVITITLVSVIAFFDALEAVHYLIRLGIISAFCVYSFSCHHAIKICNGSRVVKGKADAFRGTKFYNTSS